MFLGQFDREVPEYLKEWGLWRPVEKVLRRTIDGSSRQELLRIAILLHDIGKFGARTGRPGQFHFARHEHLSRQIILDRLHLERFGLTAPQINYIALTAGDHFVLGLARKRARERGVYDEAFTRSPEFTELSLHIKRTYPEDFVEIGVLFLGDSLSKVDPERGPARALSQHHINLEVARRYLSIVASEPSV